MPLRCVLAAAPGAVPPCGRRVDAVCDALTAYHPAELIRGGEDQRRATAGHGGMDPVTVLAVAAGGESVKLRSQLCSRNILQLQLQLRARARED